MRSYPQPMTEKRSIDQEAVDVPFDMHKLLGLRGRICCLVLWMGTDPVEKGGGVHKSCRPFVMGSKGISVRGTADCIPGSVVWPPGIAKLPQGTPIIPSTFDGILSQKGTLPTEIPLEGRTVTRVDRDRGNIPKSYISNCQVDIRIIQKFVP